MIRELLIDVLALSGIGALVYGAWMAAPPAGFMVGGVLGILVAFAIGRASPPQESDE